MKVLSFSLHWHIQNMVGPGEVDEDLEPETAEECSKYGEVEKCVIFEVNLLVSYAQIIIYYGPVLQIPHGAPENEAVRIFIAFTRLESAIKGRLSHNRGY